MADMDTYDGEQRGYEDDRDYGRERSRSPGPDRNSEARVRDEPTNGRADADDHHRQSEKHDRGEGGATNPGSNLFVTGIHPRLSEEEISELFGKYGDVEKCNIMRDPHTRESRGFGFVKMYTAEGADAAKDALQGEVYEGRTLSIEKARRARPRTPTPGKYFGPPKRDDRPARGFRDRYDDRGAGRRDDRRGGGYRDRYDDRYEDRGYGGGRRGGDEYPRERYGGGERGGGYRGDDRYSDRRGGGYGGGGYDRAPRGPPADPVAGGHSSSREPPPRDYDDRRRYD